MHFNGMLKEKEAITLLEDLISIDSVNPLEDTSRQGERKLAFHIRDYLKNIGIQFSLQWALNELRKENPLLEIKREEPYVASPPMEVDRNERVVEALSESIKDNIGSEPKVRGGKFDSDAGKFVAQGIPTPVFGPGNILEAHSKDEWVEIRQVTQAAEIIAQTIVTYQDKLPRN